MTKLNFLFEEEIKSYFPEHVEKLEQKQFEKELLNNVEKCSR